jgi:hypothetical protein
MKSSDLINNLQAMVAAQPSLGDEARSYLASTPLTEEEAAVAESNNLTPLEYRLFKELGMVEDIAEQAIDALSTGEADFALSKKIRDGLRSAHAMRDDKQKKENPYSNDVIRQVIVKTMFSTEQTYDSVISDLMTLLKRGRGWFDKRFSKKAIAEEVKQLKSK